MEKTSNEMTVQEDPTLEELITLYGESVEKYVLCEEEDTLLRERLFQAMDVSIDSLKSYIASLVRIGQEQTLMKAVAIYSTGMGFDVIYRVVN